jgi:hypothetical protein
VRHYTGAKREETGGEQIPFEGIHDLSVPEPRRGRRENGGQETIEADAERGKSGAKFVARRDVRDRHRAAA